MSKSPYLSRSFNVRNAPQAAETEHPKIAASNLGEQCQKAGYPLTFIIFRR